MKCAWLNTPLCIPYKHFLYTAYNKSAIFEVRNLKKMSDEPTTSIFYVNLSQKFTNIKF